MSHNTDASSPEYDPEKLTPGDYAGALIAIGGVLAAAGMLAYAGYANVHEYGKRVARETAERQAELADRLVAHGTHLAIGGGAVRLSVVGISDRNWADTLDNSYGNPPDPRRPLATSATRVVGHKHMVLPPGMRNFPTGYAVPGGTETRIEGDAGLFRVPAGVDPSSVSVCVAAGVDRGNTTVELRFDENSRAIYLHTHFDPSLTAEQVSMVAVVDSRCAPASATPATSTAA